MADEQNTANFTEVLDIQVQVDSFRSSLASLESEYDSFLERLGKKGLNGSDVLRTDGIGAFSSAISDLVSQIADLRKALTDMFQPVNDDFKAAAENAKATLQSEVDAMAKAEEDKTAALEKGVERRAQILARYREQQAKNAERLSPFASFDGRDSAEHERAGRFNAPLAADEDAALFSANIAGALEQELNAQRRIREESERTNVERERAVKERGSLLPFAGSDFREQAPQEHFRVHTDAELEEFSGNISQALEQELNVRQRINQEAKQAAETRRKAQEQEAAEAKRLEEQAGKRSGFFAGFLPEGGLGGISEYIGSVTRFALSWALVGAAIQAVGAVIRAPFEEIKNGIQYLEQFEERASQLKAALTQSLVFDSTDTVHNFQLAGEAADQLLKKVDDLAAKLHTTPERVQMGFETFLEYGGRNLTRNTDEALQVSGLATAALQSQNPNLPARQVASELRNLVAGNVQNGSKLAAAFGIPAEKLNEMAKHARTTHDLLDEIIAHSPGLIDRLSTSDDRMTSLAGEMELFHKRWDALIAGPLFDRFKTILSNILVWLDKHKDEVDNIAKGWGIVLDAVLGVVTSFVKADWKPVLTVFTSLAGLALLIANSFVTAVTNATNLVRIAAHPFDSDARHQAIADLKEGENNSNTVNKIALQMLAGKLPTVPHGDDKPLPPDKPSHGIVGDKPPKDKGDAQLFEQEYAVAVERIKTENEDLRRSTIDSMNAREIGVREATDKIVQSLQDEEDALRARAEQQVEDASKHFKGKQLGAYRDRITKEVETQVAGLEGQKSEAQRKEERSEQEHQQRMTKIVLDGLKEQRAARVDALERDLKAGLISHSQYAAGKLQAFDQDAADAQRERLSGIFNIGANPEALSELLAKNAVENQRAADERQKLNDQLSGAEQQDKDEARAARQLEIEKQIAEIEGKNHQLYDSRSNDQKQADLEKVLQLRRQIAQAALDQAKAEVAADDETTSAKDRADHLKSLAEAKASYDDANKAYQRQDNNSDDVEAVFGKIEGNAAPAVQDAFGSLTQTVVSVTHALSTFGTGLNNLYQSFKQGGLGGLLQSAAGLFGKDGGIAKFGNSISGLGGGLGSLGGALGSFGEAAGPVGAVIGAVGSVVSLISGIFTQHARDIGRQIGYEIQQIMQNFALNGVTTSQNLQQTIDKLNQELQKATSELSGQKGGKSILQNLTLQINQQVAQLQEQQAQIKNNFEQQLEVVTQSGQVNQQWTQSWVSALSQVRQYLDAYNNSAQAVSEANKFLSATLTNMRQDLQNQWDQGEQSAIQDAMNLNQLLIQRQQLEENYQKSVYQTATADAIERRQSQAVVAGHALQTQQLQYAQQKQQLDYQIALTQQKVTLEEKIFGISTNTAQLMQKSLAVQLDQLKQMALQYESIAQLLTSTAGLSPYHGYFVPPGYNNPLPSQIYGGIPGITGTNNGSSPVTIGQITIQVPSGTNGTDFANDFIQELTYQRLTRGQYGTRNYLR